MKSTSILKSVKSTASIATVLARLKRTTVTLYPKASHQSMKILQWSHPKMTLNAPYSTFSVLSTSQISAFKLRNSSNKADKFLSRTILRTFYYTMMSCKSHSPSLRAFSFPSRDAFSWSSPRTPPTSGNQGSLRFNHINEDLK